jgi:hypothetical protein
VLQLNLIRRLRGEDDRYEVSPALELLFPAEEIQALTETYERLSEAGANGLDAAPENDDDASEGEG